MACRPRRLAGTEDLFIKEIDQEMLTWFDAHAFPSLAWRPE
ncbi:hypothetical protein DB31_5466 [Hyalangium minutum]|uniref:Uncharacterized protein n=1 Tax=Hyalangium minutum TaxID=394096 RepID=A0A085WRW1_9BACT|nr:hypothetical protein DB31_5466 [Hyalangium minutum]